MRGLENGNLNKGKAVKSILVGIFVLVILITALSFFETIPTGFVGIKTKFGKAQEGILEEGLNFKIPYVEKIILIDCRTKKIDSKSEASTKDLQTVITDIAVNYNVDREQANRLYREVGSGYENIIISPAILEAIKSTMAGYTAEELITKRSEVSNKIQTTLKEKISSRGFNVTEFNITNIDFSEEYDEAIEAKAVKQQEVIAAQAELEKQKIQNEKEVSIAEKDAKVMELQNSQITENTLKLRKIEAFQKFINKWNGVLPETMLGQDINALLNIE